MRLIWRRSSAPTAPAATAPPPAPTEPLSGVIAITVLGLAGDELERVLDLTARQTDALGGRAVFVTDAIDFTPFRRRRLVVEQIVPARVRMPERPDLAWTTYERRLYRLVHQRWRPDIVIVFGRAPDAGCLTALREGL